MIKDSEGSSTGNASHTYHNVLVAGNATMARLSYTYTIDNYPHTSTGR